jgi:light-regulated signal transduction histidine kinase (bacteriophytochrome)
VRVPLLAEGALIGSLNLASATENAFTGEHLEIAREVADQLAVAIRQADYHEQVQRHATELEVRVSERTTQLEAVNRELEAFSYSVSHDLRAPLRAIKGFAGMLAENQSDGLGEEGQHNVERIRTAVLRMSDLIDGMLSLARIARSELRWRVVDLSEMALAIAAELREQGERDVELVIAPGLRVEGDSRLLRITLENLLSNAWKYTGKHRQARIEVGCTEENGGPVYFVRDDGAGFDMTYAGKLFTAFQRLHRACDFEGTGIGLATVHRIIARHGGRIWAEAAPERGATFYFTLGAREPSR